MDVCNSGNLSVEYNVAKNAEDYVA